MAAGVGVGVGTAVLLLHGHVHRGYTVPFPLQPPHPSHSLTSTPTPIPTPAAASFPIYNPGSAGRSFSFGKRAAAYNVYTVSRDESSVGCPSSESSVSGCAVHRMNGWRLAVERYVHNGHTFEKEQRGPYTTQY